MAKSHKAQVKKFCAFVQVPRYGSYDEVVGWTIHNQGCFRSEKKAQAVVGKLVSQYGRDEDLYFGISGPGYDRHGTKLPKPVPARRRAQASRRARQSAQRAVARGEIPF